MGSCISNYSLKQNRSYSLIEKMEYCRVCGDSLDKEQWFCEDCCKKGAGIRIRVWEGIRSYAPFYFPERIDKYTYSCRIPDVLKNKDDLIVEEFSSIIRFIVSDWNKIKTPYDIPNLEQIAYDIIMKHLETVNVARNI